MVQKKGNVCLAILDGSNVHDGSSIILGGNPSLKESLKAYQDAICLLCFTNKFLFFVFLYCHLHFITFFAHYVTHCHLQWFWGYVCELSFGGERREAKGGGGGVLWEVLPCLVVFKKGDKGLGYFLKPSKTLHLVIFYEFPQIVGFCEILNFQTQGG